MSFANRIQEVIDEHQLEPRVFAEMIGVQRSSISHILSGRNKPSADFLIKLTETFPDIDPRWLLHGTRKGDDSNFANDESAITNVTDSTKTQPTSTDSIESLKLSNSTENKNESRTIQRIILVFSDGTFEELNPAD